MPRIKYVPANKGPGPSGLGRKSDPKHWKTGPCMVTRDKYYAFLKHRSQSNYRGETHSLTWEQWQALFPDHIWECRGRGSEDLCLGRLDWRLGWHTDNVAVMTRTQHFSIKKEYNAQQ